MKRIVTLSLMAIACLSMQAQKHDVVILSEGGTWVEGPSVATKKKTSVAVWPRTEKDDWWEPSGLVVENVPTVKDKDILECYDETDASATPMMWRLTEESGETVLHCYFHMPADIVENFWLTDEEGCILDRETGISYRARRTAPDCYYKRFTIQGKKGSVLDFKIFFPKLPASTKKIAIYGVPNWRLRGLQMELMRQPSEWFTDTLVVGGEGNYDEVPQFHHPTQIADGKNYDKDNFFTWSEYTDAHLIKPTPESTMAMWLTPEATYVALATEMNWRREYFGRGGDTFLMDESGHQYKCKGVLDYPNDKLFWVQGYSGDFFAIVLKFEPVSPDIETIHYISPEGEPFNAYNASWSGDVRTNLSIKKIRENQKLFEYFPRKMVE